MHSVLLFFNMLALLSYLTVSGAVAAQQFCPGKSDGLYPDPDSCSNFYQCQHGRSFKTPCPSGLLFNKDNQDCDWPSNVDCDSSGRKTPHPMPSTGHPEPHSTQKPGSTSKPGPRPLPTKGHGKCARVVCYYTNWAQYKKGDAKQVPSDVDPTLCTHIIYAFAKLKGNKLASTEWNDATNYNKILDLKKINKDLKVLIAVSGGGKGSSPFTAMVKTEQNRKEFISSTIKFLRDNGFDGIDFDWEYPAHNGSPPEDKNRFAQLLKELRNAVAQEASTTGKQSLIMSAAVGAGKYTVDPAYDVPTLNAALDFISVMTYDLHGTWDRKTGHHSALYSKTPFLTVDSAARYWVEKGASRGKLVIGVPFYGRTFTLSSASNSNVGAPISGAGRPGKYTEEAGMLSYYEVCEMKKSANAQEKFIQEQKVPYLVDGDQWVGYEDETSLKEKVRYIIDNHFGGVMMWELSLDDMKGTFCGQGAYPLTHAIDQQCRA